MRGVVAKSSNIGMALLTRQMRPRAARLPGRVRARLPDRHPAAGRVRRHRARGHDGRVPATRWRSARPSRSPGSRRRRPSRASSTAASTTRRPSSEAATDATGTRCPAIREPRRVISAKTSAQVRDLMQAVMDSATGRAALRLDGTPAAARRAPRSGGTGHRYKGYVTSFVGLRAAERPGDPHLRGDQQPEARATRRAPAAPVYRDIMKFALPRYSVEPTKKYAQGQEAHVVTGGHRRAADIVGPDSVPSDRGGS